MSSRYVLMAFCALGAILMMVAEGRSQSVEEWRATVEGSANANARPGEKYDGVTPGSGNTLPKIEELKNQEGRFVTWPGFMMRKEGGSRFFIQSTGALEYKIITKRKRIIIQIPKTNIYLRNNKNPLVTTHFNTPARRVYLKKRKKSVECIIELKEQATPGISQIVSPDGYHYMFIDFEAGNYSRPPSQPTTSQGESETL